MNFRAIAITAVFSTALSAQPDAPKRSLDSIMTQHQAAMVKASTNPEAYQAAVKKYEATLREYLKHEAKGGEKCQTRFALVSLLMYSGRHEEAKASLSAFEVSTASSVLCAQAAAMAQDLQLPEKKKLWVQAALHKPGSFEERMELGAILMTALHEIKQAEALFDKELQAASDAEAKAKITWYLAKAIREREDLPEGSYENALQDLAKDFPNTRYGKIAADRIKAMDFRVGGDPLPFKVQTLGGGVFELPSNKTKGKPILLCFLAADIPDSESAAKAFETLRQQFDPDKLAMLGIWLDAKTSEAAAAIKKFGLSFPQTNPDGGWDSDLALRFRMENAPQCILIDRRGKIAGMNYLVIYKSGQQRLAADVTKAVTAKRP
jgi:hypothetical protein